MTFPLLPEFTINSLLYTPDCCSPTWLAFLYKPDENAGESSINSGFDKSVKEMKKKEKRLIVLPDSLAFGRSGFYAKEKPGERRFVISPYTTLVYEIEVLDIKR